MALTPEEVINKRFQATKFKEGYNPEEVDDFLDEIVIELRRLNSENASLKRQVEEAESRADQSGDVNFAETADAGSAESAAGVTETAQASSVPAPGSATASAASLLAMAQKVHDEYVAEGQREKDRLLGEGREEAETLVASAREERSQILGNLETSKTELAESVERLRGFESQYREGLRAYLEGQLANLENSVSLEKSLAETEAETE